MEQYLIIAEGQAMRRIPMYMKDWIAKLDAFLQLNERDVLTHAGKITHQLAVQHAEQEYEIFHKRRIKELDKADTDFDQSIKMIENQKTTSPKKGGK